MKRLFLLLTSVLILQKTSHCQLPACKDSFPISLFKNSSFEQYSGCDPANASVLEGGYIDGLDGFGGIAVDTWHSFIRRHHEIHYFNFNCRTSSAESIFYPNNPGCYSYPSVPLPLPDGPGFISLNQLRSRNDIPEQEVLKTYITTCLSQPLVAGKPYVFSFYFGFANQPSDYCYQQSVSPYGIGIFGRQDCPSYPLNDSVGLGGCLANFDGWKQLGTVTLQGQREWVTGAIEFTPPANISCIGIGPDCAILTNDTLAYSSFNLTQMHYMDNFVLATKEDYAFRTISVLAGNSCTGHFSLKAPHYVNAFYQWYRNGVIIPGANADVYSVPDEKEAEGAYVVNMLHDNTCTNSLPFVVKFSALADFDLGNDEFICEPDTLTLNARLSTGGRYLWQDGSTGPEMKVSKSGVYWVQVTDNLGCVKYDSIKVNVQDCQECRLFVPSAFSPNDDGLNDVFRTRPQCPGAAPQQYELRVYNRWGQLVFMTHNINDGWNGRIRNAISYPETFVYLVSYSYGKINHLQKGTVTLIR
jgi:gliding motility-associated-like protein